MIIVSISKTIIVALCSLTLLVPQTLMTVYAQESNAQETKTHNQQVDVGVEREEQVEVNDESPKSDDTESANDNVERDSDVEESATSTREPRSTEDTTAPTLSLPTNIGTTQDTTPDFSFTSSEAGDITLTGGCESSTTTATVGVNTITFNTLNEGTYSCTITVTDSATLTSAPLSIPTFTIDTTPPTLSLPTDIGTTSDRTPDFSFTSDEAGTITLTGDCESSTTEAVSGVNTITFNPLSSGEHNNCALTVTDSANNASSQLSIPTFTITDTTSPVITLTGSASVSITSGTAYTDAGATVEDSENPTYTETVTTTISGPSSQTSFDSAVVGDWTFTYTAPADDAGNNPTPVTRTVKVIASSPTLTLNDFPRIDGEVVRMLVRFTSDAGDDVYIYDSTVDPVIGELLESSDAEINPSLTISRIRYKKNNTRLILNSVGTQNFNTWASGDGQNKNLYIASTADDLKTLPLSGAENGDGFLRFNLSSVSTIEQFVRERIEHITQQEIFFSIGDAVASTTPADTTAPTLSNLSSIGTTNDNTPDLSFTTDEAGDITLTGGCQPSTTTATKGVNTITFNALNDGTYSCTITITDSADNTSDALSIPTFTIDTVAPVITVPEETTTTFSTLQDYSLPAATVSDSENSDYREEVVIVITNSAGDEVLAGNVTDAIGTYTVTYSAPDDLAGNTPTPVIREITVVSPARDDTVSTDEDAVVEIDVLSNDIGLSGGTLAVATQPSNGTAALSSGDAKITYTPNENFNGSDSFTYSYTIGEDVYTATVNLTITPVNDAPTLSASATTTHTITAITDIDLSTHFTDVDGDTLTFSVSNSDDSKATVSITGTVLTITPISDGDTTLTVTVNDGAISITQEYSITVNLQITVSSALTPEGRSHTKTLTLTTSATTITYKRIESDATDTCDSSGYSANTDTEKTYSTPLQFTSEDDNGDRICFKLTQASKDTIYHSTLISDIDTTAPILSSPSDIGTINDSTPDFSFTSNEDGTLSVSGSCSTSTSVSVSANTQKTITLNTLSDGMYSDCAVVVTDVADNASAELSIPAFTIDTTPPSAPTNLDLSSEDDLGASDSDNNTPKKINLTFTAQGEDGNTIQLYKNDEIIEGATGTVASGTATIDIDLPVGTHTITAKQIDEAENISPATAPLTITITAGTPPTLTVSSITSDNEYNNQLAKAGDTITLEITPSEPLSEAPTATIAGKDVNVNRIPDIDDAIFTGVLNIFPNPGVNSNYGYFECGPDTTTHTSTLLVNGVNFNKEDDEFAKFNDSSGAEYKVNALLFTIGSGGNVFINVDLNSSAPFSHLNVVLVREDGYTDVLPLSEFVWDTGRDCHYGYHKYNTPTERHPTSRSILDNNVAFFREEWADRTVDVYILENPLDYIYTAKYVVEDTDTDGLVPYTISAPVDLEGTEGTETSGTSTVRIDNTPPSAPSSPDLSSDDDLGENNTDNITTKTEDLTLTVTGEDGVKVQIVDTENINEVEMEVGNVRRSIPNGAVDVYGLYTRSYATHLNILNFNSNGGSFTTNNTLNLRSGDYTLEAFFCEEITFPSNSFYNTTPDIGTCTIAIKDTDGTHRNIFEVSPNVQIELEGNGNTFLVPFGDSATTNVTDGAYHFHIPERSRRLFTGDIANSIGLKTAGSSITIRITEPEVELGDEKTISSGSASIDLDLTPARYSLASRQRDEAGNNADSPALRLVVEESADLTATITPTGVAKTKTMTLEITGSPTVVSYKKIDKTNTTAECSADGYGSIIGDEETLEQSSTSILFNSEDDNGDSICFKLTKPSGTSYKRSPAIKDIDTTAPTLSNLSNIGTTTDTTPDISFTSNEDGTFALSGACASTTATSVTKDTPKTITLDTLTDGEYSDCAITVTDGAGNISSQLQIPTFTIDTTPPSAPTSLDLSSLDDTGTSDTDNKTTKTHNLVFSVDAENGSIIEILESSNVVKDERTFTLTVGTAPATLESPQTHWFSDGAYGSLNTQTLTLNGEDYTIKDLSLADETITFNISDGTDIIDPSNILAGYFLEVESGSEIIRVPFADFSFFQADSIYTTTLASTPSNAFTQTDASLNITIRNGLGIATDGSATLSIHLGVGEHTLTAVATDEVGNRSTPSTSLVVSVVSELSLTDDSATTTEDTAVEIDVLDNDNGASGGVLSVETQPSNGVSSLSTSNTKITYTPNANFNGEDSLEYSYTKDAHTYTATVTISITAVNDTPTAGDEAVSTNEDTEITITPAITDVEDTTPDITSIDNVDATLGSAVITTDKQGIIYTPLANANGVDTFDYTVTDSDGATATGTITLTIDAVNDVPTTNNPQNPPSLPLDSDPQTFDISSHFIDVEDSTLDLAITTASDSTIATVALSGGVLTITPVAIGTTSIVITATDDDSSSVTHEYTITISQAANAVPVAPDLSESTPEDTEITITPAITDVEDTTPDITSIDNVDGSLGTAVITSDKESIIYTPLPNANGVDTFSYTVTDSDGATATGTITLTIDAVNDAPTVVDTPSNPPILVSGGDTHTHNISSHFTDTEDTSLTFTITTDPTSTIATTTVSGSEITITPVSEGSTTFTITATDTGSLSTTHTYTITVTDKPTTTIGWETSNDHPAFAKVDDTITLIIDPSEDLQNTPTVSIAGIASSVTEDAQRSNIYTDTTFDLTAQLQGETDIYGYHTTKSPTALSDTEVVLNGHTYDILELSFNNEDNTITLEIARDDVVVNPLNVLTGTSLTITDNTLSTNTITININDFSLVSGTNKIIYDAGERDTTSTNPLLHDWSTGTGTLTLTLSRSPVYLATATITSAQKEGSVSYSVSGLVDTDGIGGDDVTGIATITIDTSAPTISNVVDIQTPTSDTTPEIIFTSNEQGSLTFTGSCAPTQSFDVVVGNNSITLPTLTDATYDDCSMSMKDLASNVSDVYEFSTFTIDTTAPNRPSVPDLSSLDDTGAQDNDEITSTTTDLTITTEGEKDATVQLYEWKTLLTSTITGESSTDSGVGDYYGLAENQVSPSVTEPFGSIADNTFTVESQSYTLTEFYFENNAPLEDVFFTITDADGNAVNPNDIFDAYYFEINGSTGDTIHLTTTTSTFTSGRTTIPYTFTNQQLLDLGITDADNELQSPFTINIHIVATSKLGDEMSITTTSASVDIDLVEGTHVLSARQTDQADNTSEHSNTLTIVVDTTAPSLSSPTTIGTTRDTTPDVSFTSDEDGTFTLTGSCASGTATDVSADTEKTITLDTLDEGEYSDCTITVTDTAGNTSAEQSIPTFTIDTTAPTYSDITLTSDNDPDTHAGIGSVLTLTFSVSEAIQTTPIVTIAGQTATVGTPTTNADGTVTYSASYTTTDTDTQGEVDYTISAPTDSAGNVGVQTSQTGTIIIDNEKPVIALTGDTAIELTTEEEYTEEGAEVTDNDVSYDEDATITITDSNGDTVAPEDVTDTVGTYTATYSAPADTSGNTPEPITRTITVVDAFNLDFDGNGTFTPSQDALALYLVTQLGISASILSSYVYDRSPLTASNTITLISELVADTTNTPLDFDGNDVFTPSQDALALYLVTQLRISASILSSYVYDRSSVTASTTIALIDDLVERTNL